MVGQRSCGVWINVSSGSKIQVMNMNETLEHIWYI